MNVAQLLAEDEEVVGRDGGGGILDGFDEGQGRKARPFDLVEPDRRGGACQIGNAGLDRLGQLQMAVGRRALLQLIQRNVDLLEPLVRLLHEEFDEFFLEIIFCFDGHRSWFLRHIPDMRRSDRG
jgi:hypothetical protein